MSTVAGRTALLMALGSAAIPAQCQDPPTASYGYDFGQRSGRFDLPNRLDEVSGLAFTADGRLFAHDDEVGTLHEIDIAEEGVGKRFYVGADRVRGDFEGLAIVGDRFFLISSLGLLYEFREADDREASPYRVTDLGIGSSCEVEGLDYDAEDDALFVACKRVTPDQGAIVIHRVPLDPERERLSPILVPKSQLSGLNLGSNFSPSAVVVTPRGTLILVAAAEEKLIEVDRSGRIVAGVRLSGNRHPQPEGLAIGPDGTLYIADEENGQDARITLYVPEPVGGEGP